MCTSRSRSRLDFGGVVSMSSQSRKTAHGDHDACYRQVSSEHDPTTPRQDRLQGRHSGCCCAGRSVECKHTSWPCLSEMHHVGCNPQRARDSLAQLIDVLRRNTRQQSAQRFVLHGGAMRWRPEHAGEDCREMEILTTRRGREPTTAALLCHAGLVA
jgi:hypothetical protein